MDAIKRRLGDQSGERELKRLRASIRTELIEQVLELIKPYLEPQDYVQVRKQIQEKLR